MTRNRALFIKRVKELRQAFASLDDVWITLDDVDDPLVSQLAGNLYPFYKQTFEAINTDLDIWIEDLQHMFK